MQTVFGPNIVDLLITFKSSVSQPAPFSNYIQTVFGLNILDLLVTFKSFVSQPAPF
ncbi:hypothetical protein SLEP1_g50354 [Rubroshorea leprosula]|uniref:Uncharacterized protein n=1 Tax=Rubroshorea leprosula TaxID=152421 RepID=A0AAV5M2V4_9ROSI|nr:hypothetical protein SLEP1_g50354 [Rubroshorea leprosula]